MAMRSSSGRRPRRSAGNSSVVPRTRMPCESEVLLARVVVDEPDRRVAERRVPQHLAENQLCCVACADDEHLLAAHDERARGRSLDDRPREKAHAHDEGEQEEQIDDPDAARNGRGMEVEDREHDEGGDHGNGPAAQDAPHVLRRDVPPPAVVEAEGDEDRQHDPDHEDDDVPLQVAVVVDGPVGVEADVPGEHPGGGDERRVDGDLPQTMPVDGRAHDYAGTPATERTASTTRSCCSESIPPHIGSARFSAAARSVSGSEPSGTSR